MHAYTYTNTHTCVCVCVCVCREREREREIQLHWFDLLLVKTHFWSIYFVPIFILVPTLVEIKKKKKCFNLYYNIYLKFKHIGQLVLISDRGVEN